MVKANHALSNSALVAVLSLDIRSHHVDAHARWKSKRLLADWFLSHRSVASGLEKPLLAGYLLVVHGCIKETLFNFLYIFNV